MRVPLSAPCLYPSIFLDQWAGVGGEAGGHLPFFPTKKKTNNYWRVFAVICLCFEDVCSHLPSLWRYFLSFAEIMKGCAVICRIYEGICCHLPNLRRDLISFADLLKGFTVICKFLEGCAAICCLVLQNMDVPTHFLIALRKRGYPAPGNSWYRTNWK